MEAASLLGALSFVSVLGMPVPQLRTTGSCALFIFDLELTFNINMFFYIPEIVSGELKQTKFTGLYENKNHK